MNVPAGRPGDHAPKNSPEGDNLADQGVPYPDPVPAVPDQPAVDRKLLDEIFGDVLPDTTRDERGSGRSERGDDEWYYANRPPHHG